MPKKTLSKSEGKKEAKVKNDWNIRYREACFTMHVDASIKDKKELHESHTLERLNKILDGIPYWYCIAGKEICPNTGAFHLQCYIQFKNQVRLSKIKKIDNQSHWETARGSFEENFKYCSKDKNYIEWGTPKKNEQGKRNDLINLCDDIKKGKKKKEIRVNSLLSDKIKQENEIYIPTIYRGLEEKLYPWQKIIWDSRDKDFERTINILYSPEGNEGKSTIAALVDLHGRGMLIRSVNKKEISQSIYYQLADRNIRTPGVMIFDLPRAMGEDNLYCLFSLIKDIKTGVVQNARHAEWWFDPPSIWIFTKFIPNKDFLSGDRWNIWIIDENRNLKNYTKEL
jgi:hypothetical protein